MNRSFQSAEFKMNRKSRLFNMLHIANNLDLEVQTANALRDVIISPQLEKDKKEINDKLPTLSAAVGLAMKEV